MKILLIAGHGQGDPGACSKWGQEADFNRNMATLVAERAKKYFQVELYPFEKNCYKQSKAGNKPNYSSYDLTIEFHMNAKTKKDEDGDGRFTGIGGYYHPDNDMNPLSDRIVQDIANLGFRLWGNYTSTGLYNLNTAQRQGANYFLIEQAFIDDGDDMTFFTQNQEKIADRIVKTLCQHFGINQEEKPVGWIKEEGRWWYRHQDGSYTKNNWELINGKWYFFDQNGWMKENTWIKWNERWYFLKDNGAMAENQWIAYQGKWYYLKAKGIMAENEILTISNEKYSFAANGHMEVTTSKGNLV